MGAYALDSWDIYVEGRLPPGGVEDKELRRRAALISEDFPLSPLPRLPRSPPP